MERPNWTEYFMNIAKAVATRGTCPRQSVGCVLVRDNQILTTGYNGSPPGMAHCSDVGCDIVADHCVRSNHAETNAIAQAAKHGINIRGATLFTTTYPCWPCFRQLLSTGIRLVIYDNVYNADPRVIEAAFKNDTLIYQNPTSKQPDVIYDIKH